MAITFESCNFTGFFIYFYFQLDSDIPRHTSDLRKIATQNTIFKSIRCSTWLIIFSSHFDLIHCTVISTFVIADCQYGTYTIYIHHCGSVSRLCHSETCCNKGSS